MELNQPPKMDSKLFKELCFTIITLNGGKILAFKDPHYTVNFYEVEVEIYNKHLYILLNEHYTYLSIAASVNLENITFIDEPQLYRDFGRYYKVICSYELNKPVLIKEINGMICLENRNELNRAELEQIAHWKPKKIGGIVFNYWD